MSKINDKFDCNLARILEALPKGKGTIEKALCSLRKKEYSWVWHKFLTGYS